VDLCFQDGSLGRSSEMKPQNPISPFLQVSLSSHRPSRSTNPTGGLLAQTLLSNTCVHTAQPAPTVGEYCRTDLQYTRTLLSARTFQRGDLEFSHLRAIRPGVQTDSALSLTPGLPRTRTKRARFTARCGADLRSVSRSGLPARHSCGEFAEFSQYAGAG